ncbi:RNA-binding protein, partial [Escherichia coli]
LLDGSDVPRAVLYLESVSIVPFDEVTAAFAFLEGEGDRTLAYWLRVHEAFFRRAYASAGLSFHDQMLCVCEKFSVVYQEE